MELAFKPENSRTKKGRGAPFALTPFLINACVIINSSFAFA